MVLGSTPDFKCGRAEAAFAAQLKRLSVLTTNCNAQRQMINWTRKKAAPLQNEGQLAV